MTQQEFEQRTGTKVMVADYTEIEQMYMDTDIDKDMFCDLWMNNQKALKEIVEKTLRMRELEKEKEELADFLVEQAYKTDSVELRNKAIKLLGFKEYLRRKINKGYSELWKEDIKALTELLDELLINQ